MEQHKISCRQLKRMAIVEGLGAGVFTVPAVVVSASRAEGLWPMLVAGGLMGAFGAYVWWLSQKIGAEPFPAWIRKLYILRFWGNAFGLLWFFCHAMQNIYMPDRSKWHIALPALLALGVVSATTLQKRGRFLELLFPWIMLALAAVLALAASGTVRQWRTISLTDSPRAALQGGYAAFLFCTPLEFLWLQMPAAVTNLWEEQEEDLVALKRKKRNALVTSLLVIFIGNMALWFLTWQTLGTLGTTQTPWPVAKMMQLLQFPGGAVERCDLLLVIFWIFCVMVVISGYLFYGAWMEPHRTGRVLLGFFVLFLLLGERDILPHLIFLKKWVDVPLLLLLPLFAVKPFANKNKKNKKKIYSLLLLFVLSFAITGCTNCTNQGNQATVSDIEEKNYVLSLYVDARGDDYICQVAVADLSAMEEQNKEIPCKILTEQAANLSDLEQKIKENIAGEIEWHHVYTIFFRETYGAELEKYQAFLEEWDAGWRYAPNVNVAITPESAEAIYNLKGLAKASVGQEVDWFREKPEYEPLFLTPLQILRNISTDELSLRLPYLTIKNDRLKISPIFLNLHKFVRIS